MDAQQRFLPAPTAPIRRTGRFARSLRAFRAAACACCDHDRSTNGDADQRIAKVTADLADLLLGVQHPRNDLPCPRMVVEPCESRTPRPDAGRFEGLCRRA